MSWEGQAFSNEDNEGHLFVRLWNFADGSPALKIEHKHFLDTDSTTGDVSTKWLSVKEKLANGAKFLVIGYASSDGGPSDQPGGGPDDTGNNDANRRLAWRRAFTVCDYLRGGDGSGQAYDFTMFDPDTDTQLSIGDGGVLQDNPDNSTGLPEARMVTITQTELTDDYC
jgi:hypothetical protein